MSGVLTMGRSGGIIGGAKGGEECEMRYYVRCARCGARVRVYARRENCMGDCGEFRLVKCGRCRCVVGDYREGERIGVWYGAKMWRV